MTDPTIQQAQSARLNLEHDILELIAAFESSTDLQVGGIELQDDENERTSGVAVLVLL